jgi:hypothetical protein
MDNGKTDRYIVCITKEIHTVGQEIVRYSLSPIKRWPKSKTSFQTHPCPRSQPHNALATTIATIIIIIIIIIIILPFILTLPSKTRVPIKLPQTTFIILPIIPLRLHNKPNPSSPVIYNLPSANATNNISYVEHTKPSTKDQAKHIATPTNTAPETFARKQQFPNLQNHPHNYRRLQLDFQNKRQKREYYR